MRCNHKAIFNKLINIKNELIYNLTNNFIIDNFIDSILPNGIYTLNNNDKFKLDSSGNLLYIYNFNNQNYNIIFKFFNTIDIDSILLVDNTSYNLNNYHFNIKNYISNTNNDFVAKIIYDVIRTIIYNFKMIKQYNFWNGKIPIIHNVINNTLNINNIIPIFIEKNLENAYSYNSNYGSFLTIGYYSFNSNLVSVGAVDVIAHELTHSHSDNSFILSYDSESGAINESLADIFGISTELYMGFFNLINTTKEPLINWSIGDNILDINNDGVINFNDKLRSFTNSTIYPLRINTNQYKWFVYLFNSRNIPINLNYDYGGVHFNSAILNHFFYRCCVNSKLISLNPSNINTSKIMCDIIFIFIKAIEAKESLNYIFKFNITYQQFGSFILNYVNKLPRNNIYKNPILNALTYSNLRGNVNLYGTNSNFKIATWFRIYAYVYYYVNSININASNLLLNSFHDSDKNLIHDKNSKNTQFNENCNCKYCLKII
jgi:hypothetical protein